MTRVGGRIASAILGALFGVLYGVLLAVFVGYFTDGQFRPNIVWNTTAVFAALGLILGPAVGDVIGSLFHLVVGLFAGIFSGGSDTVADPEPRASGWLRALFLIGFGTGIALCVSWRYL